MIDLLLLNAVESIYDAAPDPDKWPEALTRIAACFDDVGANLLWRRRDGRFVSLVSPSLAEAQKDYESNWATRDFKAILADQLGFFLSGEPFADMDLYTEAEIRAQPFFTDFLLPHGLGWFGSIAVSPDPEIGVTLIIQRDAAKPLFSREELEQVRLIGRHIEKSLRLSLKLLDGQRSQSGLREALSRIGIGVFALDSEGRLTFHNEVAAGLIGTHFRLTKNRLGVASKNADDSFAEALSQTLGGDPAVATKPIIVEGANSPHRVIIYLIPLSEPRAMVEAFMNRTRAIVLAIQPQIGEPADPALVRDVLGLTLGEARVASLVGAGISPRETAAKLGITENTARNLLKRAFSKTGVSRQSELAILLSTLVRVGR